MPQIQFILLETACEPEVLYRQKWRAIEEQEFREFAREQVEGFWRRINNRSPEAWPIPEAVRLVDDDGSEVDRFELYDLTRADK
jgi:hypothetical protein